MLKSIHLVGASLEVGEHHYHYVSSGLCCSSIMFSKQPSRFLSNPQNHHFTFFVTLQIHNIYLFVFFFHVRCFFQINAQKLFPFVLNCLKYSSSFFLVLVFPLKHATCAASQFIPPPSPPSPHGFCPPQAEKFSTFQN